MRGFLLQPLMKNSRLHTYVRVFLGLHTFEFPWVYLHAYSEIVSGKHKILFLIHSNHNNVILHSVRHYYDWIGMNQNELYSF